MSYCPKCGAKITADAHFCPSCGTTIPPSTRSIPEDAAAPYLVQRGSRPSGVILLSLLEGIVSFFMLLGGVALLGISALLASGGWDQISAEELAEALQQYPWVSMFTSIPLIALTTAFLTGIGIVLLILALLGFIMSWGLWSGRSWARTTTMILAIISIITGIFSLPGSLIEILINILIIYYLTRPHIRAYYR